MEMSTHFTPSLVMLSVCVAIFASYVALNLARSVTETRGRVQTLWLACGSIAMGVGIWSMHFIGMLAFEMPGMAMGYDVPFMLVSIGVAIGGSALALFIVSRPDVRVGSVIAGAVAAAIAGMHYIGMFSMRMEARIEWNIYLVFLSILIALAASLAALKISIQFRDGQKRQYKLFLASALMGVAIAGMHYTGMIAANFVYDENARIEDSNLLVSSGLTFSVITSTLVILGLALAGSFAQRLFMLREKHAKDSQIRSEERFRHIIEAVKDYAIFTLDPSGIITTWNSGAKRITGYEEDDVIGRHVSIFYDRADNPDLTAVDLSRAQEAGSFEIEAVRVRKNNSQFWANIVINPLYNSDGVIMGFVKIIRDITKLKEAEERSKTINEELERRVRERTLALEEQDLQLRTAKKAADVANETKSAFLANMSHEIRTPLGAILGFSELMMSEDLSHAERTNTIEIIKRNGKLLSTIINDILDLSKVEAGKLEIEKTDVHLHDLINEISSFLNLEASNKGVGLKFAFENVSPFIVTDPTRLRQILINMIGNAIKFTSHGEVEVIIEQTQLPKKLRFVIADTGAGIDAEQAKRLFSPFTQADPSTTRKFGGTGLGLVLSKKLAQALGGDVTLLRSGLGQGSTFLIEIVHEESVNPKQTVAVKPLFKNSKQLDRIKVLVVDDSSDNQALLKTFLLIAGAEVETANNGREGVQKAMAGDYSVVLMDLQMPEMDGYAATKALRTSGYHTPIIALTAHAMKEERKRCLESGFNDHLTKPIDREALIRKLTEFAL